MRLRYILPRLNWRNESVGELNQNHRKTDMKIRLQCCFWSLSLALLFFNICLLASIVLSSFGQDWRSQIVDRYALVFPLSPEDSIYAESLRQELDRLLQEEVYVERYKILTDEYIREEMNSVLESLPDQYDYTLPLIAYVSFDAAMKDVLIEQVQNLHPRARLEDRGAWTDTIRVIADFFFFGGLWLSMFIVVTSMFIAVFQLRALVWAQNKAMDQMLNLGTSVVKIRRLMSGYCCMFTTTCALFSGIISAAIIFVFFVAFVVPLHISTVFLWLGLGFSASLIFWIILGWVSGRIFSARYLANQFKVDA